MARYSIELRTRKYVKGYGFLSFARKFIKQLLDTGLDALKRVAHKAHKLLWNKIAGKILSNQTMIILRNKNLLKK